MSVGFRGLLVSANNPPYRDGDHVWVRAAGIWEALFWVLAVVVAAGTLASTDLPVGRRLAEVGLVGALAVWYVLVGGRAFRGDDPRYAVGYVLGMIALSTAGYAVYQLYGLMFFILYPHIWSLLRERWAAVASVARGLSNAEVGRVLYISEATVKTHLLRAFEKLGVSDRTAAVTAAIARGVLPAPR